MVTGISKYRKHEFWASTTENIYGDTMVSILITIQMENPKVVIPFNLDDV